MTPGKENPIASIGRSLWQSIFNPWTIGAFMLLVLIALIMAGISFSMVYGGMASMLMAFGVISFWVRPLRGALKAMLIVGALFYLGGAVISHNIIPPVENYISTTFPAYKNWKVARKEIADNKLAEETIAIKKGMIDSEVIKGTFGIILEKTAVYDEEGNAVANILLKEGQRIMSLGLERRAQMKNSEGMVYVLLANEKGDFVKSISVLVPIRKVKWGYEKEKLIEEKLERPKQIGIEKVEPKKLPAAPPAETYYNPTSNLELKLSKTVGKARYYKIISLTRTDKKVSVQCQYGLMLKGTSIGNGEYIGKWTQGNISGSFRIKFAGPNNAVGTAGETTGETTLIIQQA